MGEFPPFVMGWDFTPPLVSGVVEDKDDDDDDENGTDGTGGHRKQIEDESGSRRK